MPSASAECKCRVQVLSASVEYDLRYYLLYCLPSYDSYDSYDFYDSYDSCDSYDILRMWMCSSKIQDTSEICMVCRQV